MVDKTGGNMNDNRVNVDMYIDEARGEMLTVHHENDQLKKTIEDDRKRIAELESKLVQPDYLRFLHLQGILKRFGALGRGAKKLLLGIYRLFKRIKNRFRRKRKGTGTDPVLNSGAAAVSGQELKLTPDVDRKNPPAIYLVKVSVVIPTKNGGEIFEQLVRQIVNQLGIERLELIVVDSGSTDRTIEIAEYFGGQVIRIRPEEFSHSYARNLGAKHATGDYILFMTQDAVPTDEYWLYRFITPLIDEKAVAASAMETQREYGDLKYKVDNWSHNRYLGVADRDKIGTLPENDNWEELRKNAQLADVSCLVRRDVFERFGYRGDFAEDLRLGIDILRAGEHVALLSSVRVVHAHARIASYYMKRNYVDIKTIKDILPDYPVGSYSLPDIIGDIRQGYICTCTLIDRIGSIGAQQDSASFFDGLSELLEEQKPQNEMDMDMLGGYVKPYQDADMETFIGAIADIAEDIRYTRDRNGIYEELAGYIRGPLRAYICESGMEMDSDLIDEIKETIYKTYCGIVGTHLAFYSLGHSEEENRFTALISGLGQGV